MDKAAMKRIEKMAIAHGLKDFKWIRPRSVILGQWVRMKCNYGCPGYGKRGTCPLEVPSGAECIKFLKSTDTAFFTTSPNNSKTHLRGI